VSGRLAGCSSLLTPPISSQPTALPTCAQDVTLLHFRKTGNRFATALLGLRIPDDEMEEFEATLEQFRSGMEREFVFTPLSDRERDVFSLFI
jgi:hypothetical protein